MSEFYHSIIESLAVIPPSSPSPNRTLMAPSKQFMIKLEDIENKKKQKPNQTEMIKRNQ